MGWKKRETPDPRYGAGWGTISLAARSRCKKCCYCLRAKPKETHHVRYVDHSGELLLDRVTIGEDVFPVCLKCHTKLHSRRNWVVDFKRGENFNHNRVEIVKKLKLGYNFNQLK